MTPLDAISSDGTANDPSSHGAGSDGIAFAFAGTLIFYVLAGPLAGVLAILLPGYGIQLYHIAWSNIELYWLHSLHCPPMSGGDCLFLNEKMTFLPSNPKFLPTLVLASYAIGVVPAASAGVLVAIGMSVGSGLRFWHVLLFGVFVGIPFSALLGAGHYLHDTRFLVGLAFLIYICVFATVVCWLPARLWWPQRRAPNRDQGM
jgi:hypothetical protein